MSKAAPRGYKNAGSDSYASTSGNLDLFDKTKDHFGLNGQNGQVIKREPTQQRVRGRCDKCCTVFLFILLVICVLIGAGGIALCIVYFNTDSSTTGFKIGGIVLGVVTCIVGIILIILTIFKQTHKRPWKQKKEKNFFYAQDYRKNSEKDGQKNIENLMDSGSQMYMGNNDNNPNRNNTRSINNNSGQLNNSFVASNNSFGPLSTSNGGQSTKNTYVNPAVPKTTYVNPPIVDYVDNQPVMYSLSDPPPEPIVTSVVEPTQLRTGNSNPVQYQTITTKPTQQDLITFPAQNQPVVATPLQEYVAVSRPMQRTNQTTRQDLIYFTSEDEEKALRNRGTFTSFDRPGANSTLRSSQSDIIPSTRSNITESVVIRRVPIPTTKVITHQQQQQQPPQTPPPSISTSAPSQQPNLEASNEAYRQLTARMIHCTIPAVKGLLKSIVLSKAKHCLQDTLRLLTLWFEYGQYREVHEALVEGIRTVPVEVWLQVLPQLIARIDSPRPLVHQLIRHLLIDVGRQHPQALIYPLVVASKSVVREREIAANRVLNNMREHSHTLVSQALVVSEELIRISILWHEKWHEGLEEASRQYFGERSIQGMIDTLEPLHGTIERGSSTLNERTFLDSYSNDLSQAHECIRRFQRTKDQRELHQAWDLYHQVFKRIHAQLPNITSLELDYVSPRLATHCRDLELAVPGTYEPHKTPITIRSVHSRITVITSKQRPRKISITGSDGYEYVFLLKGHEDLRQDERVMQLFGLVNEFLSANDETRRRNFIIQRYPVIPLAPNNGLLGWVAQCDTFHALIKEHREKARIMLNAEHRYMQGKAPHYDQLPLINKVEVFEYALNLLEGDDLAKILWHKSSSAEIWLDRRSNYTRSLAVMSMVGYILGLGDRHPSNLMLDRASGKVVHIDFGDCFEVAMTREKFPEKIPFRLTRMLRKAMEVTGIDGTFRMTCEHVMDVLRKNRDSLMAVLEAFVHDPLLNWRLLENNTTEQTVAVSGASNRSPQAGQLQQPHYQPHLSTVNEEDNEHESTIGGTAQQQNVQQQNLVPQPGRTIRAVEIMNRVREKLTGSDFHREQPVDIPMQVELLIKQATSHENLCQSYIGWCPFW